MKFPSTFARKYSHLCLSFCVNKIVRTQKTQSCINQSFFFFFFNNNSGTRCHLYLSNTADPLTPKFQQARLVAVSQPELIVAILGNTTPPGVRFRKQLSVNVHRVKRTKLFFMETTSICREQTDPEKKLETGTTQRMQSFYKIKHHSQTPIIYLYQAQEPMNTAKWRPNAASTTN